MLFQFDGTLIVIAISFIIFTFIMQKIFYGPITDIRHKRNQYIEENHASAKAARDESENLKLDYDNRITQAKLKGNKIVSSLTFEANQKKSVILEHALNRIHGQLSVARASILKEKQDAKCQLKDQIMNLAHDISTRILGEEIPMTGISGEMVENIMENRGR